MNYLVTLMKIEAGSQEVSGVEIKDMFKDSEESFLKKVLLKELLGEAKDTQELVKIIMDKCEEDKGL
jgi:hypothetical protein